MPRCHEKSFILPRKGELGETLTKFLLRGFQGYVIRWVAGINQNSVFGFLVLGSRADRTYCLALQGGVRRKA